MLKAKYFLMWLPIFIIFESAAAANKPDCHGHMCNQLLEYCSDFLEGCDKCEHICNVESHNYDANLCSKECTAYHQYTPLQKEIMRLSAQNNLTITLLIILVIFATAHFLYKFVICLHRNRVFITIKNKFIRRNNSSSNAKNKTLAANQNVITISDVERTLAPATEASMATLTTPISRRYPAENSSSPVSITDFSYENQALAVTPVFDKSNGGSIIKEN